ncbi:hypothetical protein [Dactylosporangium darangshiense]|uniref:hypothetical protein n=1 Tax=Dactylosporangium darangshiense TaxID=579108 RepID=UPI00362E5E63
MVADEHLAVVDAPLRVGLETGRVEPGVALGVPADEDLPVGVEVQGRGQQGEPSNSSGRIRASAVRTIATVFDVPKSMPSTRMCVTLPLPFRALRRPSSLP